MDHEFRPDDAPRHGFQGDRRFVPMTPVPAAASVAVSREVGARGGAVARRVATKLGWQVYDRENLEYASRHPEAVEMLVAELPPGAGTWVEGRQDDLRRRVLLQEETFDRVAQLILTLGARGEAVFVGGGAGFVLPRSSTLNVRIVAPLVHRVAYMGQLLRLPPDDAAEYVREKTSQREQFLGASFLPPDDGIHYDLVLNSSTLGEELCADLIVLALRSKCVVNDDDSSVEMVV